MRIGRCPCIVKSGQWSALYMPVMITVLRQHSSSQGSIESQHSQLTLTVSHSFVRVYFDSL